MWKVFFALSVLLSADAQRFKFNEIARDGVEISEIEAYQDDTVSYRLPNNTRPESYVINLNFGDFHNSDDITFMGQVAITIRVLEKTDTITLHSAVEVSQDSDVLLRDSSNIEIPTTIELDGAPEFLIIHTSETLLKNETVHLTISYQGTIGASISGIYRGSYEHDTERRW